MSFPTHTLHSVVSIALSKGLTSLLITTSDLCKGLVETQTPSDEVHAGAQEK